MKRVELIIGGHPVTVAFDENSIHVFNAFPVKDRLKSRGYRWNPAQKSWDFRGSDVQAEISRLEEGGAASPAPSSPEPPPPGLPESLSVSELRDRIDALIRSALPATIWVRGVVASDPKAYRWATYFDLRDEDDSRDMVFACEMRASEQARIEQRLSLTGVASGLEKDLPVFLAVEVNLSRKYTVNVRLRAVDVLPEFTRERLRSQRDVTVDRLRKEGLLEKQKELRLPMLLGGVGLITSAMGTSVRDILAGMSPMENRYRIGFLDTRMEGGAAVDGMIDAMDFMEFRAPWRPEALIIARGGGSEQSLGVFNDYRLCARICRCTIPVLTAIGHEKDLSAAEICSHFTPTPSTPSGMGRFLRERFIDLQARLGESVRRLVERFAAAHGFEGEKLRARVRLLPRQGRRQLEWTRKALRGRIDNFLRLGMRTNREHGTRLREMKRVVLIRSGAARERELRNLERAAARMDFERRALLGEAAVRDLRRMSREVRSAALRKMDGCDREAKARENLARASHPDRILERGFTITMDPQGRAVSTAREFRSLTWARLRFADGTERIERKEE